MNPADVLIAPVVSEKSYSGLADRKYTFKVHQDAHKTQVRQAVEQLFGVKVAERPHDQGAPPSRSAAAWRRPLKGVSLPRLEEGQFVHSLRATGRIESSIEI